MTATSTNWQVYIIEASDSTLYTGITTDLERRFSEHLGRQPGDSKSAAPKGAKYFNGRIPVRVVYHESGHDRSSASRREAEIKKLSRAEKLALITACPQPLAATSPAS